MRVGATGAELRFDQTVPRRLVHKSAVEQVLLTDGRRLGGNSFAVAAHLPRSHMLFGDSAAGFYDATLLGEAFRQAVIYVTHRFLDVAEDVHFVIGRTSLRIEDVEAGRVLPRPQTLEMTLETDCLHYWRDGTLRDYEARVEARVDGRLLLGGSGVLATLPPRRYATMRGQGRARSDELPRPPRDPGRLTAGVGRTDPRNRLLAELTPGGDGYEAALAPDLDHPVFFDHPQDHLPGSLLVEALRQVAVASSSAACRWDPDRVVLTRFCVEFESFAELGAPVRCAASVRQAPESAAVEAVLRQEDSTVARARVELRPV
jgi:2-oxo-3-(phosphooxy)propyl 3-oxoalkanoate synthase